MKKEHKIIVKTLSVVFLVFLFLFGLNLASAETPSPIIKVWNLSQLNNDLGVINGTNGVDGINGSQGIQGISGINGTNGINGINGTNGINGINGTSPLIVFNTTQFDNSTGTFNLQDTWLTQFINFVSNLWTDAGNFLHPTNTSKNLVIGTNTDDGTITTKLQVKGTSGNFPCPDPVDLYSNPTYSSYYDLYGVYDAGSYADTSTGSFIDDTFDIYVYSYATASDMTVFYSYYSSYAQVTDATTTLFQVQAVWGDYGGYPVGAEGYVVVIYQYSTGQTYYKDVGATTTATIPDWTGWTNGGWSPSPTAPYYIASGSLMGTINPYVYAYKTTNGVTTYSATPYYTYDSDPNYYYWQTTLSWSDVSADGYIVYDAYQNYWIDVGNTFSVVEDGTFSGWNYGSPTVTPTPYAYYDNITHFYNDNYGMVINGFGQADFSGSDITKPSIITPSTVEITNLNANYLQGNPASAFLTAEADTIQSVLTRGNTITGGTNIALSTSTGTKIGTATNQKLGFFNVAPVVQQTATTDLGTVLSNLGLRATGTAYPITTSGTVSLTGSTTITTLTSTTATIRDAILGNATITEGNITDLKIKSISGTYAELTSLDVDPVTGTVYRKQLTNQLIQYWANNYYHTGTATLNSIDTLGGTWSIGFTIPIGYSAPQFDGGASGSSISLYANQVGISTSGGGLSAKTNLPTALKAGDRIIIVSQGSYMSGTIFYVNGVAYLPDTYFGSYGNMYIGNMYGSLDEVVIWHNKVISQAEATLDYNARLIRRYYSTDASNPSHIYHFDEGSGTTILDSLAGADGTTGGSWTRNSQSTPYLQYNANVFKSESYNGFDNAGVQEYGDNTVLTNLRGLLINSDLPIQNNINVLGSNASKITPNVTGSTSASAMSGAYNALAFWTEGVSDTATSCVVVDNAKTTSICFVNGVLNVSNSGVQKYSAYAGDLVKRHRWFFVLGGCGASNDLAIFKDGLPVYVVNSGLGTMNGWTNFVTGSTKNSSSASTGTIDELIIWSTNNQAQYISTSCDGSAVSAYNTPAILKDWNNGQGYFWTSTDTQPPQYIYHFDENNGVTASSGNTANDLTFGIAPIWTTSTMSRNITTTARNVISKTGEGTIGDLNTIIFGDSNVNTDIKFSSTLYANGTATLNGNYSLGNCWNTLIGGTVVATNCTAL